jgi:Tfp pilus assembly protein PilO
MKTQKPSQGAQLVLVAVALVAAAAGAYLFLIGPKRAESAELTRRVEATQAQIDSMRVRAETATPSVPALPAVDAAELFRLVKAMPDQADMANVLLELNRLATETGIVFDSITPGTPAAAGTYQTLPIALTFAGNFYELSDFLFRLRSLVAVHDGELSARGRLYNVESISFAEGTRSFPQLTATLTVDAYVFGPGDAAPATAPATEAPQPSADTAGASS